MGAFQFLGEFGTMQSTVLPVKTSTHPRAQASSLLGLSPQGMARESSYTHESPRLLSRAGWEGRDLSAAGCRDDGTVNPDWGGCSSKPVCWMERLTMAVSGSGQVLGLQKSLCSLGCVPRLKPHTQSSLQCCYYGCDRACATSSPGTALHS